MALLRQLADELRSSTGMAIRPLRRRLPDFAGRLFSLSDDAGSWRKLRDGKAGVILLGLGPNPGTAPVSGPVSWLEAPETLALLQEKPLKLPEDWRQIDLASLNQLAKNHVVFFHSGNLRLAPEFWGPVLAHLALADSPGLAPEPKLAWLPGQSGLLLHDDLAATFAELGFSGASGVPQAATPESMAQIWQGKLPAFALSVNFRGLDPEGRIFELLRALKIPLAIWLVDNPWHILSGITLPWWKHAQIFLTDKSFIAPLQEAGARQCAFLPLAASPFMFGAKATGRRPPIFVGSSAFAGRDKFFAGLVPEPKIYEQAQAILNGPQLPDFHWWESRLPGRLWPGRDVRKIGAGCDACSATRRSLWVKDGLPYGLDVIGDPGWCNYLPELQPLPPVDYSRDLPALYAGAECVLNVTSLLLPESLNQRHFDVWAAGGFLFSDATPGLEIFPAELTDPIKLASPADFGRRLAWLRRNPQDKRRLNQSWRELIAKEHTYACRVKTILNELGVSLPKD